MPAGFIGVGTLAAAWWSRSGGCCREESLSSSASLAAHWNSHARPARMRQGCAQISTASFIIHNYYQRQKGAEENLQRLCCVLLRIQATVEEAEGRQITNQAMLQQLQMLREVMYEGCYLVDTFGYRMLQQKMNNNQVISHLALIKLSPAKRFCFSTRRRINRGLQGDGRKEIQKMLESLHDIINEMADFVAFLTSCPPVTYQPYSKYLIMEKSMFGRQAEMKVISFLLQPESPGTGSRVPITRLAKPSAPHSWFHINPAKHKSFYRNMNLEFQDDGVKNVQKMLGNLHNIMGDRAEFIFFLKFYPPMSREPYSMHLFLENCIFGCKAEMKKIVGFLLQPKLPGTDNLQVLQIIGPPRVGKSTLVEHICYDERVHNHFSSIILCNGDPTAPEIAVV
ncbi:hypothetical protein PR202_ga09845 [Eleusine coracana subsp. coracana]|uniref:Disease resistance N-terminal domain-containing protein n=1 Tax=Eleusine coracana subsp. coracana TaxID=191504 RepID=A0AAV5C438_ELECO|nr:hypothetical protein PR202_ga09845 [Eleusine coracana subsp. coracana]